MVFSPSFAQAKNETKLEWLDLTFDGIKKSKIDYKKNASGKFDLHKITVNQSASPLFLPMNKKISNITVKGLSLIHI